MKILEVCTSRSWGGMEMRTLKISEAFKELGHSVTLLCHPESSLHNDAVKSGIETITLPFKNGIHLYLILKLSKHLKQNRFDLIHTQFSRDLRFLVPALKGMNNTPLVLTKRLASFINKKDLFHKYLYNRVDLITAISKVIQENVIETCPVEPSKVEIFYNGINVDKFQSALKLRVEKEKNLG
ncbi:MAG: glycosyltransferase family 4 protein [Melioribacteraceae bacterium]|nr:glycosyltransferase family 4 protein [Melioribacteraceae bacterium]